jgi:hypothetical protein
VTTLCAVRGGFCMFARDLEFALPKTRRDYE